MKGTMTTPDTVTLVEAYAALEETVHGRIGEMSGPICSRCETPCCKPEHCRDVPASAWLRAVAEARGATVPEEATAETSFLGSDGCSLRAGWPPQCTWYICDGLELAIRDPLERYVYQVLSSVLGHVIRGVTRDLDLTDVEVLADLTERQRARIGQRIRESAACAEAAWELRCRRSEHVAVQDVAASMLRIARLFPFAARPVRFEGEPSSLSRAARERVGT